MTRNRSSLDPGQIIQSVYNEESMSYDVTLVDTEMNLSLSADEGDSIKVEARSFHKEVKSNEEFDVEGIDKLRIYTKGSGFIKLEVSPDGEMWFHMWDYQSIDSHMSQCIENVMAKKARISSETEVIHVFGKGN